MRRVMLLAGAAAMVAAMPLLAQGQGQGRGKGGGNEAAEARQGGGQGRGKARAERGRAEQPKGQARRAERGGERQAGQARQQVRAQERQVRREVRQDRRGADRAVRDVRRGEVRAVRDARRADERLVRDSRRIEAIENARLRTVTIRPMRARGFGRGGCPPGLARQNAFCMPPGQLRKAQLIGQRLPLAALGYNVPERYRYRFADDDRFLYRYGDGAVYRIDRATGLVSAISPIRSAGLFLGEPMPLGYEVYNVPLAYRGYYPDTRDYYYRYDDGAIYRVNAGTSMVDGIVALLSGGGMGLGSLGVGSQLPIGYDAYNVPFAYRDRYYDTDESLYRYADGNIYQVDPQTQLIESIISLIA